MPALFISYRRTDSPDTVKLIHERLKRRLPRWEIFYDHESIPLGEQFPERLRAKVARGEPIIGGGAGTGISAKCEEAGGIDLIVVYNSGRFRMAGRGSLAGLMPKITSPQP